MSNDSSDRSIHVGGPVTGSVLLSGEVTGSVINNQIAPSRAAAGEIAAALREILRGKPATKASGSLAPVRDAAIVFTDVVDSVRLNESLRDQEYSRLRQRHLGQAAQLIGQVRGQLVKNTGDGVFALFETEADAIWFACELSANPGDSMLRIRAGVHAGPVILDEADACGTHVNTAARVMQHAERGGVRVSDAARTGWERRADSRGAGWRWRDFGAVPLKGLSNAVRIWGVD